MQNFAEDLGTATVLCLKCPHCGHTEHDDFEVLEERVIHQCKCESCLSVYWAFFVSCDCGHDTVKTWGQETSSRDPLSITCEKCCRNLMPEQEQDFDW